MKWYDWNDWLLMWRAIGWHQYASAQEGWRITDLLAIMADLLFRVERLEVKDANRIFSW